MYTSCPQCNTVHSVNAAQVSHAHGMVKCGQCGNTFSALRFLFDDIYSTQAHSPAQGTNTGPPVLVSAAEDPDQLIHADPDLEIPEEPPRTMNRLAWGLAAFLLVLVTIANTAWTFREPLMENPAINSWLKESGRLQVEREGLLKDPQQIQLVSRDIHTHPTRSGILVLNLTFVNLAQRSQVYPVLGLTLLDAASQPIARREFLPTEYLRPGVATNEGLAADVYLPVLLELGDPGENAVGFEIRFL